MLREGSQTEPNGLAARLMPRPMMNAHPISTVARPMANANGRQSLMVYRSQDAVGEGQADKRHPACRPEALTADDRCVLIC